MYFEVDFIFLISKQYEAKVGVPLASNASGHWMDQLIMNSMLWKSLFDNNMNVFSCFETIMNN